MGTTIRKLARLIQENSAEIIRNWASLICESRETRCSELPQIELQRVTSRGLAVLVDALATDSHIALDDYVAEISRQRVREGFRVAEVAHAYYLCRDAVIPVIQRTHSTTEAGAWEMLLELDSLLHHVVGQFTEQYVNITNGRLLLQQARTATMLDMLQTANSTLDLEEVLCKVSDGIAVAAGAQFCGIFLVDVDKDSVIPQLYLTVPTVKAHYLRMGRLTAASFPLVERSPLFREVVEQRKPMTCYDAQTDPRTHHKNARLFEIKSILAIPLIANGHVVAEAWALTTDYYHEFTDGEIELAVGVANSAALAVENAWLYAQVEQLAVANERTRLSREIHDGVAQALGVLQMKVSLVDNALEEENIAEAKAELDELRETISLTTTGVREAIFGLRATIPAGPGFLGALRDYLVDYQTHYGLRIRLDADEAVAGALKGAAHSQAIRIIQEALTNIRKHSGVREAHICLVRVGDEVCITVEDNGCGFDPIPADGNGHEHVGLQVMKERAESVGGTLTLDTQPNQGTRIVIQVPIVQNRGKQ